MPEAFRLLKQAELQLPSVNPLLEQGIYDYNQALGFAATTPSESLNALKMVADSMADSGVSPIKALDILRGYNNSDSRYMDHRNLVIADVHAMLGDEVGMREALRQGNISEEWRLSPYLIAIKTRVRNGDDPTSMVEEAMAVTSQVPDREGAYGNQSDFRAKEYLRIVTQLVKLNQDGSVPLAKAEEEMDKLPDKGFLAEREVENVIHAYSDKGKYQDALRLLDRMNMDRHSISYYRAKVAVVDAFVNAGDFDHAIQFAKSHKMNREVIPTVLARKAIHDTKQGYDVTGEVANITQMDEVIVSDDRFRDIFPLLGIALAKSGATAKAKECFSMIEDAIRSEHIDLFEKAEVYFKLAHAVHDAGMDSDEIYTRAWDYSEEWWNDEEIVSFSTATPALSYVHEDAIKETIKRGKFEHARKSIDAQENVSWWKALHMSQLAAQEIRQALSESV